MKILVVDDERLLVKGIKFNLENEGYTVDAGYDGEDAVNMARSGEYDLIILDLMMPKKAGLQACQEIRSFSTVPIIMLTARSEGADLLMGFESGADDYVTKPFSPAELTARVDALIRRLGVDEEEKAASEIVSGPFLLNTRNRTLEKDGQRLKLTQIEYLLVKLFMENPGKAMSREDILAAVWGNDFKGELKTVDVNIRRLRIKIESDPTEPEYITTVWGYGYKWGY